MPPFPNFVWLALLSTLVRLLLLACFFFGGAMGIRDALVGVLSSVLLSMEAGEWFEGDACFAAAFGEPGLLAL